jgi:hypothetical protein
MPNPASWRRMHEREWETYLQRSRQATALGDTAHAARFQFDYHSWFRRALRVSLSDCQALGEEERA